MHHMILSKLKFMWQDDIIGVALFIDACLSRR